MQYQNCQLIHRSQSKNKSQGIRVLSVEYLAFVPLAKAATGKDEDANGDDVEESGRNQSQ